MADELEQYKAKAGAPDELAQYAAKPSAKQPALGGNAPPPASAPGWLDRPIPLTSYTNATLSGLQSIGRGVRGAVQGVTDTFNPAPKPEEAIPGISPVITAMPGVRMLRGAGNLAKQSLQVPGAIRDINASPDPLGAYAGVAQETAGQGAGQALTALATEGLAKAGPYVKPVGKGFLKGGLRKAASYIPKEAVEAYKGVKAAQAPVEASAPPAYRPGPEPAPAAPGTYSQTVPVRPSAAAPTYEAPLPGVNTAPNVGRMDFSEPTSALQRASEPPAPANPAAMPVRPSLDRIAEPEVARPSQSVKPVEPSAALPPTRAAEPSVPASAKPVVPSNEAVARMERARGYRLGSHSSNPEAEAYLTKTNQELIAEANARKIDGRSDWKVEDLKRTGSKHGKFLAPAKEDLIGKLVQPDRTALPKSTDISEAMSKDKSLADLSQHEANMRQRSLTAQQEREKLGPLGLKSQEPTTTSPPSPGQKATRYYNKYGKVERR